MATDIGHDDALDKLFSAGRSGPQPSDALMARIAADAVAQMPQPAALAPARRRRKVGLAAGLMAMLGGWPALTGMASAAAAGVWIGIASPDLIDLYGTTTQDSYTLGDFLPDIATLADGN